MRIALALTIAALPVLAAPMVAHAGDSGEDRYGPPPVRRAVVSYPTPAEVAREETATAAQASSYAGPYLRWSSKGGTPTAAPAAQSSQAGPTQVGPTRIAPAQVRPTQAAPRQAPMTRAYAPAQPPVDAAPRYAPSRTYAPAPSAQPAPPSQPLPSSLYGQATPAPRQEPRPQYQAAARPAPPPAVLPRSAPLQPTEALPPPRPQATASAAPAAPQPAPQAVQMREPWRNLHAVGSTSAPGASAPAEVPTRVAIAQTAPRQPPATQPIPAPRAAPAPVAPTPATSTQMATVEAPAAPVHARFYSLHRDYGDTPDPVTLPAARPMVLIGPNQLATAPSGPMGSGGAGDADGAMGGDGQAQTASAQAAANAVKPKAPTTGTVY